MSGADALIGEILASGPTDAGARPGAEEAGFPGPLPPGALTLARSREGRPVRGVRVGRGSTRISLLAGCHADEPVGPRLLFHLTHYLSKLPATHPLIQDRSWWIVPHANPDGAVRNRGWQAGSSGAHPEAYDVDRYQREVVREAPGDDMEFGFPRGPDDEGARPENRAIHRWWASAPGPFDLHVSLHGMAFATGPWFLMEPAWVERAGVLRRHMARRVAAMGYRLHDVDRKGEKGFVRIEPGFSTRPDSEAMRRHFLALDDPETAGRFRPSSMEAVRALGGDALTLVTEMPLFITPDPERRERVRPMPAGDQMSLQWAYVAAGLALVEGRL